MTNTTHTPERIHDEQLLALFAEQAKAEQTLGWKLATYRSESMPRLERHYGHKDTRTIAEVAVAMEVRREEARFQYEGEQNMIDYCVRKLDDVEHAYHAAVEGVLAVSRAMHAHEDNYTGWQRFWLVTSSAGLVHRDMNCSTCNKGRQATTFALLPTLSGQPVDKLVEAFGPVLCSVCWPEAPVAWTDAERIPARIAQLLLDEGIEAFEAARAKLAAKRGGAKDALAAELATCQQMTVRGPQIKLAEKLVEEGVAAIVQRGGHTSWKGRWTPELIIKPVTA